MNCFACIMVCVGVSAEQFSLGSINQSKWLDLVSKFVLYCCAHGKFMIMSYVHGGCVYV